MLGYAFSRFFESRCLIGVFDHQNEYVYLIIKMGGFNSLYLIRFFAYFSIGSPSTLIILNAEIFGVVLSGLIDSPMPFLPSMGMP